MTTADFHSVLQPVIQCYLELKQALGRVYYSERYILRDLDRFLAAHVTDLTAQSFAQWCQTQNHLKSGVRRDRMRVVRNLCLYRRRTQPNCFVPDLHLFPARHQSIRPYLFTATDIERVLQTAATLTPAPHSPLRAEVMRLAVIVLYTTGLRRGELLRLRMGDYDPRAQTLLIRPSKFHKSRYVALSPTTAEAVEDYLQVRRQQRLSVSAETPLISHRNEGYSAGGFSQAMRDLFDAAGLRTAEHRRPRVHDLRHAFAVTALLRWYRNGDDVQAKLPLLATYMGHVSIVSTAYYLSFIDDIATLASQRFATHCGDLITGSTAATGEHP